tara:strand:- start:527 stop:775 length:249 start_codon:yes stop_codon:yes gene_type:complete
MYDNRNIKTKAKDDVQNLRIALQLITRTRCHWRAGWDKATTASREQRVRLDEAGNEIRDVMLELERIYLTDEQQEEKYRGVA